MNCMKCGREIDPDQVFCPACLEEMEKYPVKPGTVVQLPRRSDHPSAKRTALRKKAQPLEEQLKTARKRVRALFILWLVTLALAVGLAFPAVSHLMEFTKLPDGQNYSAATVPTTLPANSN